MRNYRASIQDIEKGFATTLVIHTEANIGGLAFNKVIPVGEFAYTFFMVDPGNLKEGLHFGLQYIDSMTNEYIQEYTMKADGSRQGKDVMTNQSVKRRSRLYGEKEG